MNHKPKVSNFKYIQLKLTSPEAILKRSYGEVTNAETVNFKNGRPIPGGLFCEKTFGPVKDWTCRCGKYKNAFNANVVCPECGVLVTKSIVRRERMGHIELQCPVVHTNYLKATSSTLNLILDVPLKSLEKIIYYAAYVILDPKDTGRKKYSILSERDYKDICQKYGKDSIEVSMGGEAILKMLEEVDMDKEIAELEERILKTKDMKVRQRLDLFRNMKKNKISPTWIVLRRIPVSPPDMRPMVQISGGRFATSDINDLYRRLINRNIRLKKMLETKTPDMIIKNEKRLLQSAVDSLFANGKRGDGVKTTNNRLYKSFSDSITGKNGIFRLNLLGKRVDYSGRSVIVVGPELKLNQCGLPKKMALELFKPYVIKELRDRGLAQNTKMARKMIDSFDNKVWNVLEFVIKKRPVLLNRAPTLHRLGIQAFEIVLIDGLAIRLHPLVCSAFNADFDGDQMAVHLPLKKEAIEESYNLMLAPHNILNPKDGKTIAVPSQDMVIGLYYLTMEKENSKINLFSDKYQALKAYESKIIDLQERIIVRINNKKVITTAGKLIFSQIFPEDFDFVFNNIFEEITDMSDIKEKLSSKEHKKPFGKKNNLKEIINTAYHKYGEKITVRIIDNMKSLGFKYATLAGITIAAEDIIIPEEKKSLINSAENNVKHIRTLYNYGFLTEDERYASTIMLWEEETAKLTSIMMDKLNETNPIFMMADSGARGSKDQIKQLAAMRGLMADTVGKTIEFPVKANFKEGIPILDYFTSAHGARKGGVDTALKTADSGYLTRRLVDVAQDVIIKEEDCGTNNFTIVSEIVDDGNVIVSLSDRIAGRYSAEDIYDDNNKLIVGKNKLITIADAVKISSLNIKEVKIRSVLKCECKDGLCVKCYGHDLSNWQDVSLGTTVGIIAAQSIGEPGTQLTMRTFHTGGIAGSDITMGLPRVEQLFEAKNPPCPAQIAPISGVVSIIPENKFIKLVINETIGDDIVTTWSANIPYILNLYVQDGQYVNRGDVLTSGSLVLQEALDILGRNFVEEYIIDEIEKVYVSQGVEINTKHIEVIIRQMLKQVIVDDAGETELLSGTVVDVSIFNSEKQDAKEKGLSLPTCKEKITGIKKVALSSLSFLSAASFQETNRVLTEASIRGKIDYLRGPKENIIIGAQIPAGTAFRKNIDKGDDN